VIIALKLIWFDLNHSQCNDGEHAWVNIIEKQSCALFFLEPSDF